MTDINMDTVVPGQRIHFKIEGKKPRWGKVGYWHEDNVSLQVQDYKGTFHFVHRTEVLQDSFATKRPLDARDRRVADRKPRTKLNAETIEKRWRRAVYDLARYAKLGGYQKRDVLLSVHAELSDFGVK